MHHWCTVTQTSNKYSIHTLDTALCSHGNCAADLVQTKVPTCPRHADAVKVQLQSSLPSPSEDGEWSAFHPFVYTPEEPTSALT